MDVVYVCQAAESNEPLRHSLRSLANLPHDKVWIVGYKPKWLHGVEYVPTTQRGPRHANTWKNWQAIAATPGISDRFVLFNDDFYVTRTVDSVPDLHRGSLDLAIEWYGQRRLTAYRQRAAYTRTMLNRAGLHAGLNSYELHTPMVVDHAKLVAALGWLDGNRTTPLEHISKRTFYGNWAGSGGVLAADVKVQRGDATIPSTDLPYLSTSPESWGGLAGGWVRRAFPDPSPYELRSDDRFYQPPLRRPARARR